MKEYNWETGEFIELDVFCDTCGEIIDSSQGYRISIQKDEFGNRIKVQEGSCCAGRIRAYNNISKKVRELYRSRGQVSDDVLKKMPKAPKPLNRPNSEAGKEIHNFLDTVGRSKLRKQMQGQMKVPRKNTRNA
jgi:hypothetical protein